MDHRCPIPAGGRMSNLGFRGLGAWTIVVLYRLEDLSSIQGFRV